MDPRLREGAITRLESSRRAVMATIRADGRPRLVPIAFAVAVDPGPVILYSALDEKPKSVADVHDLARVRDIVSRPEVSVLVDVWSEDWAQLAWVRLDGTASLLEPADPSAAAEHSQAIRLLRARYPQYAKQRLEERPILRIAVEQVSEWAASP